MVGVPGKYKGCNTCRVRRVKCDNERPLCRKCLDSGRECAGYERETVFIIGTIEDQGRCSSHPPRVVKSKKSSGKKSSSNKRSDDDDGSYQLVANTPLRPAWDDLISLSCQGQTFQVQIAALFTPLNSVTRAYATDEDEGEQNRTIFVSFPTYQSPDLTPYPGEEEFQLFAQCMVHLAPPSESPGQGTQTDSIFMFLYEHNTSTTFPPSLPSPWKDPSLQTSPLLRRLGPSAFRHFPHHHFFTRVYRPAAIWTALLSSTPTFLSSPEWQTTPFESHPASPLDQLLSLLSLLPALFARFSSITSPDNPPTLSRRLLAQDLLLNMMDAEARLHQWFTSLTTTGNNNTSRSSSSSSRPPPPPPPVFWVVTDPSGLVYQPQIPFTDTFAFVSGQAGLGVLYYWSSLVMLYPRMWRLYWVLFEGVIDGPAGVEEVEVRLPGKLAQVDPMRWGWKETRGVAEGICRGGDWVLGGAAQPDLVGWVVEVLEGFYGELPGMMAGWEEGGVMVGGDGRLEVGWVRGFRERVRGRGGEVGEVVGGRGWVDYMSF